MKNPIQHLNKAFESRVRLGIMSILLVNDDMDFTTLKELLDVSDGNLASHIGALEKLKYISVTKKFIGKKPNTSFQMTRQGKEAFQLHLQALEGLLNQQ